MESKRHRGGRLGCVVGIAAALVLLQVTCSAQITLPAGTEDSHERLLFRSRDTLPFTLVDGYLIVVEGRIGAHRHLKLVLDTAATHSVLRSELAKEQNFLRQPVRIVNLDRVLTEELAQVPDFELGPIRIPFLPMMLNDLSYLRET